MSEVERFSSLPGQAVPSGAPVAPGGEQGLPGVPGPPGGAPVDAEYVTSTLNPTLTAERVLRDSASVTWDRSVPGEIKAISGAGGGNVSTAGTPVTAQYGRWATATTIEGVDPATVLSDIGAAPLASPVFTGDPQAPTPTTADSDNSIATTGYVHNNLANYLTTAAAAAVYQPRDADLTALAALTGTNVIVYRSAPDTWAVVTIGANLTFSGGTLAATAAPGAPLGAEYITSAPDATLTAERVLTDTATVTWDRTAAGQIKANVVGGGAAGPPGPAGVNAYTTTAADFTVPALGATTTVNLTDASWIVVGQMLWIGTASGAGLAGPLQVTAKAGNTVTLLNPATSPGGGNVSNSGTPTAGQIAQWTDATHVKGVDPFSVGWSTGDAKLTYKSVADPGWMLFNDGTFGDALSNGSSRANDDTQALFVLLWNAIPFLAVQDSTGATVARGANALADFNAHRRLVAPKTYGRALGVAGAGAGLTARGMGDSPGAETETPTIAKTATHSHTRGATVSLPNLTGGPTQVNSAVESTTDQTGSGTPLSIMQPTAFLNVMVKL